MFDSFQSGYLKRLDYEKVRHLSVIARRIYRYLDKHFHSPIRTTLTLNLKTFAFERIGMSRSNDAAQIKRSLSKAISELESIGFLVPKKQPYTKIHGQRGEWEVTFTLADAPARPSLQRSTQAATIPATSNEDRKPDRIDRYLEKLPARERQKIESAAMNQASGFLLETMEAEAKGPLAEECRNLIVKAFLKDRLTRSG